MSRCNIPIFSFVFPIPFPVLTLPTPDFDLTFEIDLFCPLD